MTDGLSFINIWSVHFPVCTDGHSDHRNARRNRRPRAPRSPFLGQWLLDSWFFGPWLRDLWYFLFPQRIRGTLLNGSAVILVGKPLELSPREPGDLLIPGVHEPR